MITEFGVCILNFRINSTKNIHTLIRTERYKIQNVYRYSGTVPVVVVISWRNVNFLGGYSKNFQISYLVEIFPVGTNLFYGAEGHKDTGTEGQMDRETERQRDRGTEGQKDRGKEGQRDWRIEGQMETGTEGRRTEECEKDKEQMERKN
jgi:hypothetical protein